MLRPLDASGLEIVERIGVGEYLLRNTDDKCLTVYHVNWYTNDGVDIGGLPYLPDVATFNKRRNQYQ